MALNCLWKNKMGKVVIKQKRMADGKETSKKFDINIYKGNCLAIFINEYKDAETSEDMYTLYTFFSDKKHVSNILKDNKKLFWDEVVSIELNLFFKDARTLLDIFVKQGYKVKCYYKEIK